MKKSLLTAVSVLAIMTSAPAIAETNNKASMEAKTQNNVDMSVEETTENISQSVSKTWKDTKEGAAEMWKDTKEGAHDAAESVSDATEDAYNAARSAIKDDDNQADVELLSEEYAKSANGMIGEPVYNASGERVAKVHDIIVSQDGDAMMVILADGDFTGLGKLVAYDYNMITKRSSEGDIIAPLDEAMIDSAMSFSYEASADADTQARVIPSNGYSVSELLDGDLVNPQGNTLAEIENIVFRNGEASQLVVGFNKTLGLGGEKATLSFDEAELTRDGEEFNFELSANESRDFKTFKETSVN